MHRIYLFIFFAFGLVACGQIKSNEPGTTPIEAQGGLKSDQKMDTAFFWKIMDNAFAKAGYDNALKEQAILEQLVKLTPGQIQDFEILFQQMNQKASTWNNMAAHTIIEGGSSDDTFFYFRCWLISLGQKNFEATLRDPDYLATLDIPRNKQYGYGEVIFEELIPLSDKAYAIVTGKSSEDESFPRSFVQKKGLFYDSQTDIKGIEWTDADLPRIAPKLCQKFKVN